MQKVCKMLDPGNLYNVNYAVVSLRCYCGNRNPAIEKATLILSASGNIAPVFVKECFKEWHYEGFHRPAGS
jgi:hypothetical protein